MTIPEIIKKYRQQQELSQEAFAEKLTEGLLTGLTKQAVSLWEIGSVKPGYYFLLNISLIHGDWRRDMALECLKVLRPELYVEESNATAITG